VHIIVDSKFDSKEGFINEANRLFNVPKINIEGIECYFNEFIDDAKSEREFFFSHKGFIDRSIKLDGYTILEPDYSSSNNYIEKTVLDLTIYTREQDNDE
jgi:hypothetical protein